MNKIKNISKKFMATVLAIALLFAGVLSFGTFKKNYVTKAETASLNLTEDEIIEFAKDSAHAIISPDGEYDVCLLVDDTLGDLYIRTFALEAELILAGIDEVLLLDPASIFVKYDIQVYLQGYFDTNTYYSQRFEQNYNFNSESFQPPVGAENDAIYVAVDESADPNLQALINALSRAGMLMGTLTP